MFYPTRVDQSQYWTDLPIQNQIKSSLFYADRLKGLLEDHQCDFLHILDLNTEQKVEQNSFSVYFHI